MAHVTFFTIPGSAFIPDQHAQLVAGDAGASFVNHKGRPGVALDDTDEEAWVSPEYTMPGQYAGGTLKCTLEFAMASDSTNDIANDVFVEAKTPDVDTLNMQSVASWDSANSGTKSLAGTTAGDPLSLTITLTNKDSVAAGDIVRFGARRDCDSANDDATGDEFVYSMEIWEET